MLLIKEHKLIILVYSFFFLQLVDSDLSAPQRLKGVFSGRENLLNNLSPDATFADDGVDLENIVISNEVKSPTSLRNQPTW